MNRAIKKPLQQWQDRIAGKASVSPHPSQKILDLLEQAYHHSEFPRDLDTRCRELIEEVKHSIPKWPSITGHSHELTVIQHVENFLKLLDSGAKELVPNSWMSATEAAEYFGVCRNTLRKRLERARQTDHNCFRENSDPGVRKSKYIYQVEFIQSIVENMSK